MKPFPRKKEEDTMAKSRAEIQNMADKLLEEAGIQPCFKPAIPKLVEHLGLKAGIALDMQDSILSNLLLRPSADDQAMQRPVDTIVVNGTKSDKEQRFATAFQVAAYMLHKDETARYDSNLLSRAVDEGDDERLRLACALLMDEKLFTDKFKKAMKGIPNKVAICKNLGSQFGVPPYAVERRTEELGLSFN